MSTVINPIVRALDLLRALNQQPQSSLSRLHEVTGLPKSTVHRLLMTLKSAGYVKADVVKGMYSLTEKIRSLCEGYTEYDLTVEVAAGVLLRTTRETGLPLAIGTLHGGRIMVRYSSMPYSPIGSAHTTVGHEHDLMTSAMGQAYLAYCPEPERLRLAQLLTSEQADAQQSMTLARQMDHAIVLTKQRGYGLRKLDKPGSSATVAIPLLQDEEILGVLGLTTFAALITDKTVGECLTVLHGARTEILNSVRQRTKD